MEKFFSTIDESLKLAEMLRSLQEAAGLSGDQKLSDMILSTVLCQNKQTAAMLANMMKFQMIFKGPSENLLPIPPQPDVAGVFGLGMLENGAGMFCIDEEDICRNILIAGQAGSGKTNLNFVLMGQFYGKIPFWVFDFAKREYRVLARAEDVIVIRPEELKFNPLRPPPGVSPREWLAKNMSVISELFFLMTGSGGYLYSEAAKLYEIFGVWEGQDTYPNLKDLQKLLLHENPGYMSREKAYWEVCLNRMEYITRSLGPMIECDKDMLPSLVGKNVVFEMVGLPEDIKAMLSYLLLLWLFSYRINQSESREKNYTMAFFLDEASSLFDVKREHRNEQPIPIIDILTKQLRATGVGLIVTDQEPSRLSYSIKANAGVRISFTLSSGYDIKDFAASLDLDQEQREVLKRLGVGTAIVKKSFGYTDPLVLHVPKVDLPPNVTDKQLDEINSHLIATLRSQVTEPSDKLKDWKTKKSATGDLSIKHQQYLDSLADVPLLSASERRAHLAWTSHMENKIKNELIIWDYIYEVEINTGGRGGRLKIAELTPKGREYLEKQGKKIIRHGKGSVEHQFWQDRIRRMLEARKWQACIEKRLGNASIDVFAEIRGVGRLAVEVCLSTEEHQLESIRKDLETEINWLLVVSSDPETSKNIEKECVNRLNANDLQRINFCILTGIEAFLESDFWGENRNRN